MTGAGGVYDKTYKKLALGTDMNIADTYQNWLKHTEENDEIFRELCSIEHDPEAIRDRFYKELSFGTGGLRGRIGAGTNRMNIYTVGRVTFGLADYLLEKEHDSLCIAYDSRHKSLEFAKTVAGILSSRGITVFIFDRIMPTPVLSYAVRKLNADAGIVITASHNPKEYNGYKVYNDKGCQVTDAEAGAIAEKIKTYGYFNECRAEEKRIRWLGGEILDSFLSDIETFSFSSDFDGKRLPKIVYTPLNGTGNLPMKKLFRKMGITDYVIVPEQENPDGNFPTCPFPNPEEKAALSKALELAEATGAGLVMATDPDADRIGLAVRTADGTFRLLSGNETGVLMEYYILEEMKKQNRRSPRSYVVKTIVTTPLAEKIADSFDVKTYDVLTGFKYIGELIDRRPDEKFVFGMEESYGYLVGTHARDKDAISAAMTILGAVSYYAREGDTLVSALEKIYARYGDYSSALISEYFEGEDGMHFMSDFMNRLRAKPWKTICKEPVRTVTDYAEGIDGLPKSNVLRFTCDSISVVVRPSGTEPKLKFYVTSVADSETAAGEKTKTVTEFLRTEVRPDRMT